MQRYAFFCKNGDVKNLFYSFYRFIFRIIKKGGNFRPFNLYNKGINYPFPRGI